MGDIHGANKALEQCLERSGFDKDKDTLIQLGDVADGWPEVPECIETLLGIKNLIQIIGNHDQWLIDWLEFGKTPIIWTEQGGQATLDAYVKRHGDLRDKHFKFWKKASYCHAMQDEGEKPVIFCHGGFLRGIDLKSQLPEMFMWDRSLAEKCVAGANSGFKVNEFKHVFLGHTTVNSFSEKRVPRNLPFTGGNVTLMDTGGGWEGVVSIMDVDTMEHLESDIVETLYPNSRGRK